MADQREEEERERERERERETTERDRERQKEWLSWHCYLSFEQGFPKFHFILDYHPQDTADPD
jgi:hypothetical protein